jgi:cellulose/xylan binding protein with CBM9 domain
MLEVPPTCEAKRLKAPLLIDGNVHKQTWKDIKPIPLASNLSHEPRYQSWVKAAWFDTHLYLAFWGEDDDAWSTYTQHDDPLFRQEVFEFFFSPDGDLTHYYEIEWNPNDIVFDGKIEICGEDRKLDIGWHAEGMKSVANIERNPEGAVKAWSCEAGIPFSCIDRLEHAPYVNERWRVNFFRIDMPSHDYPQDLYAWSPTLIANFHRPEFFGRMIFSGH